VRRSERAEGVGWTQDEREEGVARAGPRSV
jgi:hypothetical protein